MFSNNGKVLHIDLSTQSYSVETPPESFFRTYGGGFGLVAYYLLHEVPKGADALGPDNALVFATGPGAGAAVSGLARHNVGAKSPLTGGFGNSESGGFWGHELKVAGWDAVVIKGRSDKPLYISIRDDAVEFHPAANLWGLDVAETEERIRGSLGDKRIRVASIGPAGERLSLLACIINDARSAAGRTGLGAVMGSKNLKAVAVRGTKHVEVANREKVAELAKWAAANTAVTSAWLNPFGTGNNLESGAKTGNLPIRNFQGGDFEQAAAISSAEMDRRGLLVKMEGCFACAVRCKKCIAFDEPYDVNPVYGGPEYETIGAFGTNCGVGDVKAVCKAHEMCNAAGLDTIGAGCAIAFAMECFEKGILTRTDTGGLDLRFGNAQAMLALLGMMVRREGLGELLADGTRSAAQEIGHGSEAYVVDVKGQELPMHEPRLKYALGLGYAVSPTGADHMHNIHDTGYETEAGMAGLAHLGVLAPLPSRQLGIEKVRMFTYGHIWRHLYNVLDMCMFVTWPTLLLVDLVNALTGWNTGTFELWKMAERAVTLARVFNLREGLTAADDRLPARMFEPQKGGPLSDHGMDREELASALASYYGLMGWDPDQGIPTHLKLAELNIGWAEEHLA